MAHSKGDISEQVLVELHDTGVAKKDAVLVAVSGGVDSIVLAHILSELNHKKYFKRLAIVHLNHRLRGKDADKDAMFVESFAKKLGVEFFGGSADVRSFAKKSKLGIEEAARNLRYDYFKRVCEQENFDVLALAHHADDRIETILMNIVRGTGLRGLIGIPRSRSLTQQITIIRPLIEIARTEIVAYAKRHKLRWREDKSNSSDEYTRNRIRKYVLPELQQSFSGHDLYDGVARLVETAEGTQSYLDHEALKVRDRAIVTESHPFFSELPERKFKMSVLDHTPLILIREMLIQECESLLGTSFTFTAEQWNSIITMLGSLKPRRIQLAKDLFIAAKDNILRLETSLSEIAMNEALTVSNSVKTPVGNISLTKTKRSVVTRDKNISIVGANLVAEHALLIRNWRAADRIHPFGMNGTRLVSDLLSEAGVKTEALKRQFPLVVLADSPQTVIWVPGIRASELCRVRGASETALLLRRKQN